MTRLSWWYANALVAMLDAAAGMGIVALSSLVLGRPVEPWAVTLGALCALLPDADIVAEVFRGKILGNHRATWFHAPLVVLPLVGIVAFLLGGTYWGLVAMACVAWHYAHDTWEGVIWLRPFSPYYVTYTGRKNMLVVADHDTWLNETWLVASTRAWIEITAATGLALMVWALVLLTL